MHSPAEGIFDRLVTVDTLIGDVPVTTGTALNYFQTTVFYDERLFEEADKFKPERWKSKD
jgi:cytochrome P450